MKSIEYLVQLYPEKTGKEIVEIQKEEKRLDELKIQEENKEKILIEEDIKKNGGYYKAAFGTEQYYMYKINSIQLENNHINCTYDSIVLFDSQNIDRGVLSTNNINFETRSENYGTFEDIILMATRIKEEEYNELKNYLFGVVPKFFKEEYELRQKEFGKIK